MDPNTRVLTSLQYCVDKSKLSMGAVDTDLDSSIVAGLDASLNKWAETIPHHRTSAMPPFCFDYRFSLAD